MTIKQKRLLRSFQSIAFLLIVATCTWLLWPPLVKATLPGLVAAGSVAERISWPVALGLSFMFAPNLFTRITHADEWESTDRDNEPYRSKWI